MSKILPSDNTDATSKIDTTDTKEVPVVNPLAGLTPGRMVHIVWPDKSHVPAVVISNDAAGVCELFVMAGNKGLGYVAIERNSGAGFMLDIPFDASGGKIGTWHWIERVD